MPQPKGGDQDKEKTHIFGFGVRYSQISILVADPRSSLMRDRALAVYRRAIFSIGKTTGHSPRDEGENSSQSESI